MKIRALTASVFFTFSLAHINAFGQEELEHSLKHSKIAQSSKEVSPEPLQKIPEFKINPELKVFDLDLPLSISIDSNALLGAGSSGGGDIDQLRTQGSLSSEELKRLFEEPQILKKMAIDLIKYASPKPSLKESSSLDQFTLAIQIEGIKAVSEAIQRSQIDLSSNLDETCPEHKFKSACALNYRPGSAIVFNLERLSSKKVSFAELMGIYIHEISHWYIGEEDDHNFKAGAFYREAFNQGLHLGKTYHFIEGELIERDKDGQYSMYLGFFQKNADHFCKDQGLERSVSSETTTFLANGHANFYTYTAGHRIKLNEDFGEHLSVYSQITCR